MRNSMERPTLTVKINGQDIPDFYYMLRWFARNKGNTFTYIKQQAGITDERFKDFNYTRPDGKADANG